MEYIGVGSIKKIFGRQREPYGFVTIQQPPEAKGMEAVFYLKDVLVSDDERRLLQGGLIVRFAFSRKPMDRMKAPCPFKATQVRMQDPMEYKGTVARSAQGSLIVFLDVLFRQVRVPLLAHSAVAGDRCTVAIGWKQMVRALRKNRDPVGQLMAVEYRRGGKENYLKGRGAPQNDETQAPPASKPRLSATSFTGSFDESEDDLLVPNLNALNHSGRLSCSRDSRDRADSPMSTSMFSQCSFSRTPLSSGGSRANLNSSAIGNGSSLSSSSLLLSTSSTALSRQRTLHQLRQQLQGHQSPQLWTEGTQTLKTAGVSGGAAASGEFGLLGNSIWSMAASAGESESRRGAASSSSGDSSPESIRRSSLGDSGARWNDSDWHMQTVRIAEMALPGKR